MRWFVWLCLGFVLVVVVRGQEESPVVTVAQGHLQGVFLETRGGRQISAFLGIPYAAPPVGDLRFHKPLPPASWDGTRNATELGASCLQHPFPIYATKGGIFGSEDCLYLNVYTQKTFRDSKLPVLVYIHGGAFIVGYAGKYQPTFLMDKDIVLVTINYRLGVLGFLSMEDKDLPGNYGLKDQTAALLWVQENIAQFGGDPGSVTLMGDSAGGGSVHLHMLSSLSKGLFHRGISHSGSAYCPWSGHAPGLMRLTGERFANQLGCHYESTKDMVDCLRDIPAYVLVDLLNNLYDWNFDPVVQLTPAVEPKDTEDPFLTDDPWKLTSDIPWISGITNAEGIFKAISLQKSHIVELNDEFEMIGPLTLMFRATAEYPERVAFSIKKYYFFDGDITPDSLEELTRMYSDSWFVYPVKESFRRHKGRRYFYYFDYRGANSLVPHYHGVSHFDDMQYFFPMNNVFENFNVTAEDEKMSKDLIDMWVNFATHGKPTLEESPVTWAESVTGSEYLHISKSGFTMEKDLLKERDDFWSALPYRDKYSSTGSAESDNKSSEKDEL